MVLQFDLTGLLIFKSEDMRTLIFYSCLLLMFYCPGSFFGQQIFTDDQLSFDAPVEHEMKNILFVEKIYDLLQDKNGALQNVIDYTPGLDWEEEELIPDGFDSKHKITLHAVLKGKWVSLLFKDFIFTPGEENLVIVTGTIEGRQHTECEYVSHPFRHLWVFKEDRLVYFWE